MTKGVKHRDCVGSESTYSFDELSDLLTADGIGPRWHIPGLRRLQGETQENETHEHEAAEESHSCH